MLVREDSCECGNKGNISDRTVRNGDKIFKLNFERNLPLKGHLEGDKQDTNRNNNNTRSTNMKPITIQASSFAIFLLLICTIQLFCLAIPVAEDTTSCQLRAKKAQDCSVCCALGGFNKFDSQLFQSGKLCRCYKDEKELEKNPTQRQRRP